MKPVAPVTSGASGGCYQALPVSNRRPSSRGESLTSVKAGLCDSCVHQKLVRSGRGSVFSMCLRHRTDERYPKYPRIPVERCPGYERRELSASR
jgi:hypothetical protein